jgi:hypothetical protein
MRARRAVAIGILLVPVVLVAIWPTVTFWRLRYWVEPSARCSMLARLMEATPDGGWFELRHAARSGNEMLRMCAAKFLVERGDPEGVRVVVELCYENPEGCLKFSPQGMLREIVVEGDPALDKHPSADAWWHARGQALHHMGDGRWRLDAR